jgi:hypothetical protein
MSIVPRSSHSNETERSSRITKGGTKLGPTTLGQSALIPQRNSPYLKQNCEKTQSRRDTEKAIITFARKFLRIIYQMFKNNCVFEDSPNFVLEEEVRA